jgi:hypothetical protein
VVSPGAATDCGTCAITGAAKIIGTIRADATNVDLSIASLLV